MLKSALKYVKLKEDNQICNTRQRMRNEYQTAKIDMITHTRNAIATFYYFVFAPIKPGIPPQLLNIGLQLQSLENELCNKLHLEIKIIWI